MNAISEKQFGEAEKQFKQFEAMINSMTPEERSNPDLLAKVGVVLQNPACDSSWHQNSNGKGVICLAGCLEACRMLHGLRGRKLADVCGLHAPETGHGWESLG